MWFQEMYGDPALCRAYVELLEEHGVLPHAWPYRHRLQWFREQGEIRWPDGSWSPRQDGTTPT